MATQLKNEISVYRAVSGETPKSGQKMTDAWLHDFMAKQPKGFVNQSLIVKAFNEEHKDAGIRITRQAISLKMTKLYPGRVRPKDGYPAPNAIKLPKRWLRSKMRRFKKSGISSTAFQALIATELDIKVGEAYCRRVLREQLGKGRRIPKANARPIEILIRRMAIFRKTPLTGKIVQAKIKAKMDVQYSVSHCCVLLDRVLGPDRPMVASASNRKQRSADPV